MIGSRHSCKKNNCSVKLQGGPLYHNPRKTPVENNWIIILQNNSTWLLLNDKQMPHEIIFQFVTEAVVRRCSVKKVFLESIKFQATLLKKRFRHRCFPVNFAEFLRTPFSTEHLRWLLSVLRRKTKHRKDENTRIERKEIWKKSKRNRVSYSIAICGCLKCSFSWSGSFGFFQTFD